MMIGLCSLLLLASCAVTAEQAAKRAEREAATARAVAKALSERHFEIEATFMYPERGNPVPITPDYGVQVKGDTLISYLPYYGRAYNIPYGGGVGLNFTSTISHYAESQPKKDMTRIVIATGNDEDRYVYTIDVFGNGRTDIEVSAEERDRIHFSGEMKM